MPFSPRVFIVGAGPGDPSLITLRGRRCLERADVVVYDHRVDERLLAAAREDAERIDVGAAAPKPLDQDAITYLVAEKAREGKVVVRLKWGDPFVFDSGGKEALFLHENGIPFEVVPGLPVSIAGPAHAGVPLTYPDAGDAVVLIRGHEAETDAVPRVDWAHLAALRATLVCYAGARQVGPIAEALTTHGASPDEPAVLIYDVASPRQTTVEATLGSLPKLADPDRPALLIAGPVAGLRQHLRWFDARPLFGRRIVVTRSREQAGELISLLEQLGAEAIAMPTIRIAPPEDSTPLDAAADLIERYDWIVFTSVNGVEHFMRRFLERRDIRDLKGVRVCTVGPETAAAVARYGIRVDLTPAEYRADAILSAFQDPGEVQGKRFLLPRAEIARELLPDELRHAGALVDDVVAYRTMPEDGGGPDIYRMLLDRQIDAVTFTSASTVRNFVAQLGDDQAADLLRGTTVAAIGPVTAEAARQLGIETAVMPAERYTVAALVDELIDHFGGAAAAGREQS